jgi:HSP20 family protein
VHFQEDIKLRIDRHVLHIHAIKQELPCEQKAHYFRRERTWGRIDRQIRLPPDCDINAKTEVQYLNGVVSMSFPKTSASTKVKKLVIK